MTEVGSKTTALHSSSKQGLLLYYFFFLFVSIVILYGVSFLIFTICFSGLFTEADVLKIHTCIFKNVAFHSLECTYINYHIPSAAWLHAEPVKGVRTPHKRRTHAAARASHSPHQHHSYVAMQGKQKSAHNMQFGTCKMSVVPLGDSLDSLLLHTLLVHNIPHDVLSLVDEL